MGLSSAGISHKMISLFRACACANGWSSARRALLPMWPLSSLWLCDVRRDLTHPRPQQCEFQRERWAAEAAAAAAAAGLRRCAECCVLLFARAASNLRMQMPPSERFPHYRCRCGCASNRFAGQWNGCFWRSYLAHRTQHSHISDS